MSSTISSSPFVRFQPPDSELFQLNPHRDKKEEVRYYTSMWTDRLSGLAKTILSDSKDEAKKTQTLEEEYKFAVELFLQFRGSPFQQSNVDDTRDQFVRLFAILADARKPNFITFSTPALLDTFVAFLSVLWLLVMVTTFRLQVSPYESDEMLRNLLTYTEIHTRAHYETIQGLNKKKNISMAVKSVLLSDDQMRLLVLGALPMIVSLSTTTTKGLAYYSTLALKEVSDERKPTPSFLSSSSLSDSTTMDIDSATGGNTHTLNNNAVHSSSNSPSTSYGPMFFFSDEEKSLWNVTRHTKTSAFQHLVRFASQVAIPGSKAWWHVWNSQSSPYKVPVWSDVEIQKRVLENNHDEFMQRYITQTCLAQMLELQMQINANRRTKRGAPPYTLWRLICLSPPFPSFVMLLRDALSTTGTLNKTLVNQSMHSQSVFAMRLNKETKDMHFLALFLNDY